MEILRALQESVLLQDAKDSPAKDIFEKERCQMELKCLIHDELSESDLPVNVSQRLHDVKLKILTYLNS